MLRPDKVFLGGSAKPLRDFLFEVLKKSCKERPILICPCVGYFRLPRVAIEAGYKPENIYTSDIGLFSTVLGNYFAGKPFDDLDIWINPPFNSFVRGQPTEEDKVCAMMWVIKYLQLDEEKTYEAEYVVNLQVNQQEYIDLTKGQLQEMGKTLAGIHYDVADVREILKADGGDDMVLLTNPPAYEGDYAKQFDLGEAVKWNPDIPDFDWADEYWPAVRKSKSSPMLYLWGCLREEGRSQAAERYFAYELRRGFFEYLLTNKPELLEGWGIKRKVVFKKGVKANPAPGKKVIPFDHEITAESKVTFYDAKKEEGLYYRDLFGHKLGSTRAEKYFLILIDGYVFATLGFMLEHVRRLNSDAAFEYFGFTAHLDNHKYTTRLKNMLITTGAFRDFLYQKSFITNRVVKLTKVRTVIFSRFEKNKQAAGILKVVETKRMPDKRYKLMYEAEFGVQTYESCIVRYLRESIEGRQEPKRRKKKPRSSERPR